MQHFLKLLLVSSCLLVVMACQSKPKVKEVEEDESRDELVEVQGKADEKLTVPLINEEAIEVGTAIFKQTDSGVEIAIEAHHLPIGSHGFHIHDEGICEAPSFESSGGHFNPTDNMHGFNHPDGPHAGDLENLEVEEDGTVEAIFLNKDITLHKDEANSLFTDEGTALVIHEKADDYESQPAGDAGGRIVCGVIVPEAMGENN